VASSASRPDQAAPQDQVSKLAALVDIYYAYRDTRTLLDRRDRQLAELRHKLNSAPVIVPRRRIGLIGQVTEVQLT